VTIASLVDNLIIIPETLGAEVGETAKFRCYAPKEVVWQFNGKNLPINVLKNSNGKIITIQFAHHGNEGTYTCSLRDYPHVIPATAKFKIISECKHP